ncbi:MAG: VCBS repeat-containing protein [Bryobacteraceae bacterium]|nr:VCBS repeat-containing protein [Bryobacteraceae bacterium]
MAARMVAIAATLFCTVILLFPQDSTHNHPSEPIPEQDPELREARRLLRDSKTKEARRELNALLLTQPNSAELYFQIARSYLIDFYGNGDPSQARTALALALEALDTALRHNRDHIPALKAKAVIHARAELLHYNPNLAYQLGLQIARLQPSASEYLLTLTDWLSGEVRFSAESEHRVPHDPLLGLNRSIELLDRVLDSSMPHSNEEAIALFQTGRALSRRGSFPEAIRYFELALARPVAEQARPELLREIGAAHFRNNNFAEAARAFFRALQTQNNLTDQWLLRSTLAQWKEGSIKLPAEFTFPARDAAPNTTLLFDDMAKQYNVDRFDGNGTCAFTDYDGDGKQDLLLAGSGTFLALYRNEGARFREVTAEAGLAKVPSAYSLNFVDYDNDGHPDIYLSLNGWNGPMPNRLFRNTGKGTFVDVSKQSKADDGGDGFVSLWGDLDNDGYLDLVIANGVLKDGSVPQIYHNRKDGTFTNITTQAGLNEPPTHGTIGAALGDYDRDGDLDIFFNGLRNSPDRLYRNDGRLHFTDVTKAAGVQQPPHMGYVAFFTDYNNDSWPDLLVTSLAPWDAVVQSLTRMFRMPDLRTLHPDAVRLFRNKGDGTFTDATVESNLVFPMGVMGAGVADLDNDGDIDFYFGTGDPQLTRIEPNRLFRNDVRNDGNQSFTDVTETAGVAQPGKKGHGVCFVDIDDNGTLELYAQLGGHYPGDHARNAFYRNRAVSKNHWLEVELIGKQTNHFAVGASVTLTVDNRKLYREVKGSEGFGSTNPYRLHFGLADASQIEKLEIHWGSDKRQELRNVRADRLIRLTEGEHYTEK